MADRSYRPVLAREDYGPSLVEVDMTVIGAHPPYFSYARKRWSRRRARRTLRMDFVHTPEQVQVRELTERLCADFDDAYWLKHDQEAAFPHAFYRNVADAGLLGIAMPEAYGGSGLGITEAAVMMQAIAQSGAGMSRGPSQPNCRFYSRPNSNSSSTCKRPGRSALRCPTRCNYSPTR